METASSRTDRLFEEPHVRGLTESLCNRDRLFRTLEERDLDGLVVYLRPNVYYLTGFSPPSSASLQETNGYAAVVIARSAPDDPICVLPEFDVPFFEHRPSPWITEVRAYQTLMVPFDVELQEPAFDRFVPESVRATPWGQRARDNYAPSLKSAVQSAMNELGLTSAVVGFDDLRLAHQVAPESVEVRDAYGALKYVRQVKTPNELTVLREASQINELAVERTMEEWRQGMSWHEMIQTYHVKAAELGGFVRDPGGVVVANPRGLEPAYFMESGGEDFEVTDGMHIMWDCHGTWGGYCWDGGKTWVVNNRLTDEARRIADATAQAMEDIQLAMKPGTPISRLQSVGRAALRQSGITEADETLIFFHGLGLEHIDMELPASRFDWAVEEGMVLATHLQVPGSDTSRNWLEEISLVTQNGGEKFFSWDYLPFEG